MGINRINEYRQQAKSVLPKPLSVPKNDNLRNQLKGLQNGPKAHQYHLQGKKSAAIFPEYEDQTLVIEKQLDCTKELSEEGSCTWLSSDCNSPLSSSEGSQDLWEFDHLDSSLHDQFFSRLSVSGSYIDFLDKNMGVSVFDGSRISPIDEASLVLNRRCRAKDRDKSTEKVVEIENSGGNDAVDSSVGCSKTGDSSCDTSLCKEALRCESSCTCLSIHDEVPSCARDDKLVHGREPGPDIFGSDIPSPPFSAGQNFAFMSSNSSTITYLGQAEEAKTPPKDYDSDEPLFWPFDRNSYSLPEFQKSFLCLSPRKDSPLQGLHGSQPIKLRIQKKNPRVGKKIMQEGCRRSIVFSPSPVSAATECKTRVSSNNSVCNVSTPSSLSRLVKTSSDKYPHSLPLKQRSPWCEPKSQKLCYNGELLNKLLLDIEASDIQDLVMEGIPIEKLMGLEEFDGNEGMNAEVDGMSLS